MSPEHPYAKGISVSEETLKDPKELERLKKSADQAVEALNSTAPTSSKKITSPLIEPLTEEEEKEVNKMAEELVDNLNKNANK